MQIQSVNTASFKGSSIKAQDIENYAQRLENANFDIEKSVNPEKIATAIENRLNKSEKGKKLISAAVASLGFAASVVSLKKALPKLRKGLATATSNLADKISSKMPDVKGKTATFIKQTLEGAAAQGKKIGEAGDATKFQEGIKKLFKGEAGENIVKTLDSMKIKTGGDAFDTVAATTAAVLAGKEAGDIAEDKHEEITLGSAVQDLAKVLNVAEMI